MKGDSGLPVCLTLLAAGCAPPVGYELSAAEGRGFDSVPGEVIMTDARTRLPKLLRSCGFLAFLNIPATDNVVVYKFLAPLESTGIQCIRRALPPGATLGRVAI